MSASPPIGLAVSDRGRDEPDTLRSTLDFARRRGGRGTLRQHRELWRYCGSAFRDWYGAQLITDQPVIKPRPLTNNELAELFQIAQRLPGLIRDLLKLHAEASTDRQHIALRTLKWADDRRQMLAELHQLALFAAGLELAKATRALERTAADFDRGNYAQSCLQRQRMVTACQRQIATLEDQLQALRA